MALCCETDDPVGVQIEGTDPEVMARAARIIEENGRAVLIDINMGCPVPKIVKSGGGAALMNDPERAEKIVKAVVSAVRLPVTVKFRLGWDENRLNYRDFALRMQDAGAAKVRIQLGALSAEGFQCQLHPTIARSFFADHVLQLKQPDRGFPVDSTVSLLRWRQPAGGDALLPINVTCWPESVDAGCDVNVEYTLNPAVLKRIENLRICIPLPSGASPEVLAIDGNYHYVGQECAA